MMRSLFTSEWTAPAPSAVPSFGHQLAVALVSVVLAVTIHASTVVFGV